MRLPREPFSWDEDGDVPVGLGPPTSPKPEPALSSQILSEAESVVRAAQEAIAREKTNLDTSPEPDGGVPSSQPSPRKGFVRPISRGALAIILIVACALSFLHGWSVGAKAEQLPTRSCDADPCQVDPSK